MAIKDLEGSLNVVEAARIRIQNIFDTGLEIEMSTSGGKDSICMMHLVYTLIREGKIKAKQLVVRFIDEEAIFDDVERIVMDWRKRFLKAGVRFEWFCVQTVHFNCLRTLEDNDSFVLWDEWERDNWVRPMPSFAIKNHPLLRERVDSYQDFLGRLRRRTGALTMTGVRSAESIQRRNNIAKIASSKMNGQIASNTMTYPIYDWRNDDVWLYIKDNKLDFPETYMYLYQVGAKRSEMRISQFFSVDTAKTLVKLAEIYPDLMERVERREPGAYLASMYWESEMFRRSTRGRSRLPSEQGRDWKKEVLDMLKDKNSPYAQSASKRKLFDMARNFVVKMGMFMIANHYKTLRNILIAGDPKKRAIRALYSSVAADHAQRGRNEFGIRKQK